MSAVEIELVDPFALDSITLEEISAAPLLIPARPGPNSIYMWPDVGFGTYLPDVNFSNAPFIDQVVNISSSETEDVTSSFQSAVSLVGAGALRLRARAYKVSSNIVGKANLVGVPGASIIDGSEIPQAESLGQRAAYVISGDGEGTPLAVTSDILVGANTILLADTSTVVIGKWYHLRSTQKYMDGVSGTERLRGEWVRPSRIDSGTQITIASRTRFAYSAAATCQIVPVSMLKRPFMSGVKFIGGGVDQGHNGLIANYCDGLVLDNIWTDETEDCGIRLQMCVNTVGFSFQNDNATSPSNGANNIGTTGYGVVVGSGCLNTKLYGGAGDGCRHNVAGGGVWPTLGTSVNGWKSYNSIEGALEAHESCFGWLFDDFDIYGSGSIGLLLRGQDIRARGRIWSADSFAAQIKSYDTNTSGQHNVEVEIDVFGPAAGGATRPSVIVDGTDTPVFNAKVSGNITNFMQSAIYAVGDVDGLRIDVDAKNHISYTGSGGHFVHLDGTALQPIKNVKVAGSIDKSLHNTIQAAYVEGLEINCDVFGTDYHVVHLEHCSRVRIPGGYYYSYGAAATPYAVYGLNCDDVKIGQAHFKSETSKGSSAHAVRFVVDDGTAHSGLDMHGTKFETFGGKPLYLTVFGAGSAFSKVSTKACDGTTCGTTTFDAAAASLVSAANNNYT